MKKIVLSISLIASLFASDKLLAPQKTKNILEKTKRWSFIFFWKRKRRFIYSNRPRMPILSKI